MGSIIEQIRDMTIQGKNNRVVELVNQALAENVGVHEILQDGLIAAMGIVGDQFNDHKIYVPEMLIAARAMQAGLKIVKPHLAGEEIKGLATIVLGTVKGDMHDIGKNLVGMMLEGAGCVVIDLGVDVSVEQFIEAVRQYKPQFLCLSALLTTTMPGMGSMIHKLEDLGLRDTVKVLVGGAPVTQKFADEIGADGYADNASSAVDQVKALLKVEYINVLDEINV
ncbi:MAG TPA: corrinoid protein [Desulfosporosinus sp.]|nr:corrinoid protein [Desulfosporosinus sp.]